MLAIIGTAGRGSDGKKLTPDLWKQAKRLVLNFIQEHRTTELVSGGAAWSDHMAVELFNKKLVKHLVLALPCQFDSQKCCFMEDGPKSCGATANYYHHLQTGTLKKDTLAELRQAMVEAEIIVGSGFFNRNLLVAGRADGVLAITFGDKQILKDGGTAHTMSSFIKQKTNKYAFHLDLNSMQIYPNAETVR